ncbi:MAG: glycoside hydrolase family 99-like domain-containing protein [Verrucomicrobiota bacterium]
MNRFIPQYSHVSLFITLLVVLSLFQGCQQSQDSKTVAAKEDKGEIAEKEKKAEEGVKPLVGAYYYTWYSHVADGEPLGRWNRNMRLHLEHRQVPELGLYSSADPDVIGGHIRQSEQAGIDFWAVSWWGPHSDGTLRDRILKHPQHKKLRYALLYESTGRLGTFANPRYENWIPDLEYISKTYFDHPSYLRVNGRPVVFVYLTREYFRNKGHEALEEMRERFPELYLVGDDVFFGEPDEQYDPEWAKNFDAITAYDVYGQSVKELGGTRKAIEFLTRNFTQAREAANQVGTAFIPAVAPGYNDLATRPQEEHPGRARYFTDIPGSKEGDLFRAMIQDVALPNLDPSAENMFLITSFNEWLEDSQIEPTRGDQPPSQVGVSPAGVDLTQGQTYHDYGTLYLDILKEELADKE